MNAYAPSHPTDQALRSFGLGKLNDREAEAVNKHLEECPDCRKRVAELSPGNFLDRINVSQKAASHSMSEPSQPDATTSDKGANRAGPVPPHALPPGLADHPDYEIKRELGRGGMGVVYLAHNRWMARDEVLKVMGRHIMERPGVLERFQREIRAVAKLRHPNIVTAYHATQIGESLVFSMEYVHGLDLSRMLKSTGPMPVAKACYFAHEAALGLQHAHEEGLVHRDIKPGNLMLTYRKDKAMIKILDFGLAKLTREETSDFQLTSEGQTLGTPDYISPEQIIGAADADVRSDIYSLGGTLYHLLSGRPPFPSRNVFGVYQAHVSRDAESLGFLRPEVPPELAAIVAKMMAKDPDRRFQTPMEVAQALKPIFKSGSARFGITDTAVPQVDKPVVPLDPAETAWTLSQPSTNESCSVRPLPEESRERGSAVALPIDCSANSVAKQEPPIDRSASASATWSRPDKIIAGVDRGARIVLAIFGVICLRLLVVISSVLTVGNRGAAPDEARLFSMAVAFGIAGTVAGGLLGVRQFKARGRLAVGFAGGLAGLLVAAFLHAVIRSVEPVLGPLSSHLGAIGMLWAALGAATGLILAVVIPHRPENAEIAS